MYDGEPMTRVKKGPIILFTSAIVVVIILFAAFSGGNGKPAAKNPGTPKNPYISTAAIVKIPVAPVVGTQEEKGYELVIVDGFTSTATLFDLTNVYDSTTVFGTKQITIGTLTTKVIENASYDGNSSVWTVYRTTMNMKENSVISFTTNNYQPLFDVLKYYYLSPHFVTYVVSNGYTTPVIYIYGNGVITLLLKPTAIVYYNRMTYTTTMSAKTYTVISAVEGTYDLGDAKYATVILSSS